MKKLIFPILISFLIVGCDPLYHVNYIVRNQSQQTIYVLNHNGRKEGFEILNIKPGTSDTIYKDSGVGYPKPFFEENKEGVFKAMNFFSDSTFCDSCMFEPSSGWMYSEEIKFEGMGILIVTPSDILK